MITDLLSSLKDCRLHLCDALISLAQSEDSCPKALLPLYNELCSLFDSVDDSISRLESIHNSFEKSLE